MGRHKKIVKIKRSSIAVHESDRDAFVKWMVDAGYGEISMAKAFHEIVSYLTGKYCELDRCRPNTDFCKRKLGEICGDNGAKTNE